MFNRNIRQFNVRPRFVTRISNETILLSNQINGLEFWFIFHFSPENRLHFKESIQDHVFVWWITHARNGVRPITLALQSDKAGQKEREREWENERACKQGEIAEIILVMCHSLVAFWIRVIRTPKYTFTYTHSWNSINAIARLDEYQRSGSWVLVSLWEPGQLTMNVRKLLKLGIYDE